MSTVEGYDFKTVNVLEENKCVYTVELNRPKKGNAMNTVFFNDYRECFRRIARDSNCRVVIVRATPSSKYFTVGLDLKDSMNSGGGIGGGGDGDMGRKVLKLRQHILDLQDCFTAMEQCPQPVIVAVNGACIGGGIDLCCCANIRLCSEATFFSVKEVDIGLAADLGTLQRFPKLVNNSSIMAELCFTARRFTPKEALGLGFMGRVYKDKTELFNAANELAKTIASKSPMAITSTKANLLYSRDHSTQDALNYVATWNGGAIHTEDVAKAAMASLTKSGPPEFSKL